jgi:acetylornithine deacetylase/succinyl-diaminopimelate desuccinylase-like protein
LGGFAPAPWAGTPRLAAALVTVLLVGVVQVSGPRAQPTPASGGDAPDAWCEGPGADRAEQLLAEQGGDRIAAARALVRRCGPAWTLDWTTELMAFQTIAAIAPPDENPAFLAVAEWLRGWAEAHGLSFRVIGPHDAYEIVLPGREDDDSARAIAFIAHIDVVPVTEPPAFIAPSEIPAGWTTPPFEAQQREGELWGRGSEDDKGPIAAAMAAMAALAEAGVVPDGDVVLVMGTAEEHAWAGMRRYRDEAPPARNVISIDSSFPVVVGENGFVYWGLTMALDEGADEAPPSSTTAARGPRVVSLEGGRFHTQVPAEASLTLAPAEGQSAAQLAAHCLAAWSELAHGDPIFADPGDAWDVAVSVETQQASDGEGGAETVRVTAHGQSVHSSQPEDGRNAIWLIARLADRLDLAPSAATAMLGLLSDVFVGDHYGERLGVAYQDPFMGRLSAAPTRLYAEGGRLVLEVNMRRPRGVDGEAFGDLLAAAVARLAARHGHDLGEIEDAWVGDPHFVDPERELVQTLLDVYREATGEPDAQPVSSRGSTYARLFPGAVSFGPSFPGQPYRGHAADERIAVGELAAYTDMLLEATLRLAGDDAAGDRR